MTRFRHGTRSTNGDGAASVSAGAALLHFKILPLYLCTTSRRGVGVGHTNLYLHPASLRSRWAAPEILDAARTLGAAARLRSPPRAARRLTDVAMSRLLTHLQIAAVPHGVPSSVRDRTPEAADHPRQLVEAALARGPGQGKAAAAYADQTCSTVGGDSWTIGRRNLTEVAE